MLFGPYPEHRNQFQERVTRLSQMMESVGRLWGDDVYYMLGVHLDTHIAAACPGGEPPEELGQAPPHEETLPDLSLDIIHSTMWHDRVGTRPRAAGARAALMNVFAKIMPENGQPRELNRFILRAVESNPEVCTALHAITMCALLGNYRHCFFKPPLAARTNIIRTFTPAAFLEALKTASQGNLLMFYVLREYFYVIGKYVLSYRMLMGTFFLWEKQSSRVCDMMREVRGVVASTADWRCVFQDKACTDAFKRHYRRMPKKKLWQRGVCLARAIKHVSERTIRHRRLRSGGGGAFDTAANAAMFGAPHLGDVEALLRASGHTSAADACAKLSASVAVQKTSSKANALLVTKEDASDEDLKNMYDAALVVNHATSIFVVNLPAEFVASQVAAVARRFGCAVDDWATLRRVTRVLVCPCCRKVKNFHVGAQDLVKPANVRACGFEKLVHPSPLECDDMDADTEPLLSCAATEACRVYRVVPYDLIASEGGQGAMGGVLQTGGECLTVSPCCGVLTTMNALRATAAGYRCPCCIQQ